MNEAPRLIRFNGRRVRAPHPLAFQQPDVRDGSKAGLKPRMLKVRSSINSGHSPKRQSGLFLFKKKLKILPMNQAHRSASCWRQRIDHPTPKV
jgi:hypothetical protein